MGTSGRRNFADFISGYVEPMTARYVGVASGKDLGECSNLAAVTWGQRAPIGGLPDRSVLGPVDPTDNLFLHVQ